LDALVDTSAEKVVMGDGAAPHVRDPKKRKATNEGAGRVPVTFAPPVEQEASSSAPTQATLNASWGETRISAVRQAFIDYNLLRFIVCCAIAFSVVDNGFFIDFVKALWVLFSSLSNSVPIHYSDALDMVYRTVPISSQSTWQRKLPLSPPNSCCI
jgi:hypothetical protein